MDEREVLIEDEVRALLLALLTFRKDTGATEAEMEKVIDWAMKVKMESTILQCVFEGNIVIDVTESGQVLFAISERGKKFVNALRRIN